MRTSIIATISCGLIVAGCNPFSDRFVTACESSLKSRLPNPSEFREIAVTQSEQTLSREQYRERLIEDGMTDPVLEGVLKVFDRGQNVKEFTAAITYKATGTSDPAAHVISVCTYVGTEKSSADYFFVKIDGQTYADWLSDHVQNPSQAKRL